MFNFGDERQSFNNVVERGHQTLQHLLLEDWSASWETPDYPPAHGDFAVYDINDLKEKINYAVGQVILIRFVETSSNLIDCIMEKSKKYRSGTETIRTQIQPSDPKRELN